MNVYLDLVFLLNFFLDSLLLWAVSAVLKRSVKTKRIVLGGLVGSSSTIFLLFKLNSTELFLFKTILSILMVLVCFSFHTLKETLYNLAYLYFISILLGGFLYYFHLEFSYEVVRNLFVSNTKNQNVPILFLLLGTPLILYGYVRGSMKRKKRNTNIYKVELIEGKKKYLYTGYLDTGNKLYDPYSKRPVHLLYDPSYHFSKKQKVIYVPYQGLGIHGIIPCVFFDKMVIDGEKELVKVLVGFSKEPFQIEGMQMILQGDEILKDT